MVQFFIRNFSRFAYAGTAFALSLSPVNAGLFCEWCVEPMRPYYSPACEPNWGVHVTSWKQFPMTHTQNGDYCPQCEAGGAVNSYPMETMQGTPVMPQGPQAIVLPQQSGAVPPAVFSPPSTDGAVMYEASPGYPGNQSLGVPSTSMPLQIPQGNAGGQPTSPGAPVPMPMQSMPPAPTPMDNQLQPMPANPGELAPQPDNGVPGPMPLPDFPGQAVRPQPGVNRFSNYSNPQLAVRPGSFRQRVAPVPAYQQPAAVTAAPLIQNHSSALTRVPVQGVSFTETLPANAQAAPQAEVEKKSFWKKLPSLPFFGKSKD